jgi:hypothetical protein
MLGFEIFDIAGFGCGWQDLTLTELKGPTA